MANGENGKTNGKDLVIKYLSMAIGIYLSVALTADFFGQKATKDEVAALRSDVKKLDDKFDDWISKKEVYEERFQNIGIRLTTLERKVEP